MENKKYKLIKEYPSSPLLGCYIIIEGRTAVLYNDKGEVLNKSFGTYWVEDKKYSEFWEEVVEIPEYVKVKNNYSSYIITNYIYKVIKKYNYDTYILNCNIKTGEYAPGSSLYVSFKSNGVSFIPSTKEEYEAQNKSKVETTKVDYEILSLKYIKPNNWLHDYKNGDIIECKYYEDKYRFKTNYGTWDSYNNLDTLFEVFSIYSVKRLSDGEVFTIGDKVNFTRVKENITKFTINSFNKIEITLENYTYGLNSITKEQEFILPEKWCVKRNMDNYKIINSYFNKIGNTNEFIYCNNSYFHFPEFDSRCYQNSESKPGYIEITFEQFEKYVLNNDKFKTVEVFTQQQLELINKMIDEKIDKLV